MNGFSSYRSKRKINTKTKNGRHVHISEELYDYTNHNKTAEKQSMIGCTNPEMQDDLQRELADWLLETHGLDCYLGCWF